MTPHVLIVDDDASDREALAAVLHLPLDPVAFPLRTVPRYEFHFAPDGACGLRAAAALAGERARHGVPVVVCCDLAMPGMDGLEFCVRLRADPATRALPVLAVTGIGLPEVWETAHQAGADGLLVKPVHPREARLHVAALARGRGGGR